MGRQWLLVLCAFGDDFCKPFAGMGCSVGLQYGFYLVIIGAIILLVGAGVELMVMRGSPAAAPPTPAAEMRPYANFATSTAAVGGGSLKVYNYTEMDFLTRNILEQ